MIRFVLAAFLLLAPAFGWSQTIVSSRPGGKAALFDPIDCTSLTTGVRGDRCWEEDANNLFGCEPTAGGCDTPGEWTVLSAAAAETNNLETTDPPNVLDNEVYVGSGAAAGSWLAMLVNQALAFDGTAYAQATHAQLAAIGANDHHTPTAAETNNLETTDPPNVLDTEIYIGTGAATGAWAVVSGDATMTNAGVVAVGDDSHAHTGSSVSGLDISDDTNLTVSSPITLTGDDLGLAALGGDASGTIPAIVVDDVQTATANLEAADNSTTQVATTSFVQQEINGAGGTNLTCSGGTCNVDPIDISDDTNLTVSSPITLTGDDLGLGTIDADNEALTLPSESTFWFASCIGATATLQWDDAGDGDTAPTAACNDTTNIQRPSADFSGSAVNSHDLTVVLPSNVNLGKGIDFDLWYVTDAASPTGNAEWDLTTVCRAVGEDWDGTFNGVQTITDAVGADEALNLASQASITTTGCAGGEHLTIHLSRDGTNDSNNDLAKALNWRLTIWEDL